ncbi:hypothetical protein AX769_13540 [Frondihabitans sp. PAMC 28766]|uniref:FAD-binding protein n=1 Tax=Frondihabitans sp. PAMC 28766 TaxID=1795630 RepID=UPI00078C6FBB|nr:FAD-binding protein [Frondihabitans sp. PAMC 28766]AMM22433.1 hypothetical protein AX769_13540 [Frondihabitans sp. PAMC 28766]
MTSTAERDPVDHDGHEQNWAGTYTYGAARILSPHTIDELQEAVAREPVIRALGTRHSFNAVADSPGALVTTTAIPANIAIAADRQSVTVGAGTRYAELATVLEAEGLALHNMGSLPHISVGGAIATGTHGSGTTLGSLSTAVRSLEIVGPDGTLRTIRRGDEGFDGSVIALGALGVTARVTLDVEPSFRMRQDAYLGVPWSALEGDGFRDVMGLGYSVSLFTDYGDTRRELLVKTRVPDGAADVPMPDELVGAHRDPRERNPIDPTSNSNPSDGTVGPWSERLPHFRIDRTPSVGSEIQSEWVVDLDDAGRALGILTALGDRIRPHLHVTEIRTIAADDLWLSTTAGRDSIAFSFTWKKHPAEVGALLPVIEEALRPLSPRPHWGKMTALGPADVARLYPRLDDFRALVADADPARKFAGGYVDHLVLGR